MYVNFTVLSGKSIIKTGIELKEKKYINSVFLFKLSIFLIGGKIKAGDYKFNKNDSVWNISKKILNGKSAFLKITIPEGYTIKQIYNLLYNNKNFSGSLECKEEPVLCNIEEGDLFPDTYFFSKGTKRSKIILTLKKKNG